MRKIANAKNKILTDMDSVCEKLVSHSHWARKKKNYRILHELCRAEYECGDRDYSFNNLGLEWKRLGDSKAISWDTYIELPQAWAAATDGILISSFPKKQKNYKLKSSAGKADYEELDLVISAEIKRRGLSKSSRIRIKTLHQICKSHHEKGGLNFSFPIIGHDFNNQVGRSHSKSNGWAIYSWVTNEWAHATGGTTENPDSIAIELERMEVVNYIDHVFDVRGLLPTNNEIRANALTVRTKRFPHANKSEHAATICFIRFCFVLWEEGFVNKLPEGAHNIFSICDSLFNIHKRIPAAKEVSSLIEISGNHPGVEMDVTEIIDKWSRLKFALAIYRYFPKREVDELDEGFLWMALHKDLALWQKSANQYMQRTMGPSVAYASRYVIYSFMVDYLLGMKLPSTPQSFLILQSRDLPSFYEVCLSKLAKSEAIRRYRNIVKFIEFTLTNCDGIFRVNSDGYRVPYSKYRNPLPGLPDEIAWTRSTAAVERGAIKDMEMTYLIESHPGMERWRQYGVGFLASCRGNLAGYRRAVRQFLNDYILGNKLTVDPDQLLSTEWREKNQLPVYAETLLTNGACRKPSNEDFRSAEVFIDYVLMEYYSAENDFGRRIVSGDYSNPLYSQRGSHRSQYRKSSFSKSNKEVLPSRFIRYCREIICPDGSTNFNELKWAQSSTEGSWFEVPIKVIDKNDPDCVWRARSIRKDSRWHKFKGAKTKLVKVYEIWSPVIAISNIVKLELPLRQYQVRLLDSGEADSWRYSGSTVSSLVSGEWKYHAGGWVKNESRLIKKATKNHRSVGVFRRMPSSDGSKMLTGLYVNTNKTADKNKDQFDRGYEVPWQHAKVLYWLEKLRDWQEKYNPINSPTPCEDFPTTVIGDKTPEQKRSMGSLCCLFRDAAHVVPARKKMPIVNSQMVQLWKKILIELENVCAEKGHTAYDGSRLIFMAPEARENTNIVGVHYPLHSLRVSLITHYSTEGGVDPSILSECIAGHASVIMTLYYKKSGITHVSEQMDSATKRINDKEVDNLLRWAKDATLGQLEVNTAYVDIAVLQAIKKAHKDGGGALIRTSLGLCAKGGEGCDSGGISFDQDTGDVSYREVPGYPSQKNCVRCRWFLTGPAFLHSLVHHWNSLHWHLADTGSRYLDLCGQQIKLEREQFEWQQIHGKAPFPEKAKLDELQHNIDSSYNGNEKLAGDSLATLRLIARCRAIVDAARDHDSGVVLVAAGGMEDVQVSIRNCSELEQILTASAGSLIYAEPDVSKAVYKAGAYLDRMLTKNGLEPVCFMQPDSELPIVVSHMIRFLQAQAGSISRSVPFIEGVRKLEELGIGAETAQEMLQTASAGIQLRVAGIDSEGPRLVEVNGYVKKLPVKLVEEISSRSAHVE